MRSGFERREYGKKGMRRARLGMVNEMGWKGTRSKEMVEEEIDVLSRHVGMG